MILIGWIGRALQGAWMVLAGSLGFVVRSIGRGARDLEPHHRRDGVGLLTLGVAIVLAGGLWLRMDNPAGRGIQQAVTGGFGSLAFLVPVLVALLAWRFLRHPDRNSGDPAGRDRLDRPAARPVRPARDRQGHAASVRRRGRDPQGGRLHRVRGGRAAGQRPDSVGGGAAARLCWPSSACCSLPAPRCTGSPNACTVCACCSGYAARRPGIHDDEDGLEIDEDYEAGTGVGPSAQPLAKTSGCARPWRAAITSSRMTRR